MSPVRVGTVEIDKRKRARKQAPRAQAKAPITRRLYDVEQKGAPQFTKIVLGFLVAILLTILLAPNLRVSQRSYRVGDIASRDIKAPEDLLVQDIQATEERVEAARKAVPSVFDLDSTLLSDLSLKVKDAFSRAHSLTEEAVVGEIDAPSREEDTGKWYRALLESSGIQSRLSARASVDPEALAAELRALRAEVFKKNLDAEVGDTTLRLLEANRYRPEMGGYVIDLIKVVLDRGLVGDGREYLLASVNGIVVRDLQTGEETRVPDTSAILDKSSLEPLLHQAASNLVPENPKELRTVALRIAERLIRPNLIMNRAETQTRIQQAVKEVKPVYFQIRKGEMILREGDPITEEKLMKLQGLTPIMSRSRIVSTGLGLLLLAITILYLGWIYLSKFKHWAIRSLHQLVLLSAIFVGNVVIIKGALYVAGALAENQGVIGLTSFYYALPFAIGAMLAVILFDMEIAVLISVATFILVGVLVKENISYALLALVGSLVASFRGKHYRQRSTLLVTGVFIGLGNLAVVVSADLISHTLLTTRGAFDVVMGFLGGLIVGIVVSGILPIFESLFNMATDIKLLELSDLNHPLLREMVVQAPGSYHHSVIVGNLAEEAAKHVGASSLFARVASYYHDVGKIFKPEYFIENQQDSINRHDKLSPSMSSLILMSHVKDGVELAKEHKLPPAIIDIIHQHHGTSLISFFYNKAKEQKNHDHQQVNEDDFRYHGPKPKGKEAAIVLLADSVEAASRTLEDPTPARLRNLVQRIVNHHFIDGQLDDCDLTLKDLHHIVESFVRILTAIFHQRITYPQQEVGAEEIPQSVPDLDFGGKQTRRAPGQPSANKKKSQADIGNIGL